MGKERVFGADRSEKIAGGREGKTKRQIGKSRERDREIEREKKGEREKENGYSKSGRNEYERTNHEVSDGREGDTSYVKGVEKKTFTN